jgi:hypothetical protein
MNQTRLREMTLAAAVAGLLALIPGCPRSHSSQPGSPSPAAWVELFPDQDWNDVPPGQGEIFAGTVRYVPGSDQPSFVMRYNPFKLEIADEGTTDIYCGSDTCLAPFVGLPVEIEGSLQTMEIEGEVFVEIWPARIRPSSPAGIR